MAISVPSPWILTALAVHGVLGCFNEILYTLFTQMAVPFTTFYNETRILRGETPLDASQVPKIFSTLHNAVIVGTIVSTLFVLPRMDAWGRKIVTVYIRTVGAALAAFLILLARQFHLTELMVVAHFLIGVNEPIRLAVTKLYLAECSPDRFRGFIVMALGSINGFAFTFVQILAMPEVFGTEEKWHHAIYLALALMAAFLPLALLIPESPKYLQFVGADKVKVLKSLHRFHGRKIDADAILTSYKAEFGVVARNVGILELWRSVSIRPSLPLVYGAAVIANVSASHVFVVYGMQLKMASGFSNDAALLVDIVPTFFFLPFSVVLPALYEKVGRRPMYLLGLACNILGGLSLFVSTLITAIVGPCLSAMILSGTGSFVASLYNGFGCTHFYILLIADLLPVNAKSVTAQSAFLMTSLAAILINFGYASLQPVLGPIMFVPLIAAPLAFFLYCWRNLPETQGRAIAENVQEVRSRAETLRRDSLLRRRGSTMTSNYGSM